MFRGGSWFRHAQTIKCSCAKAEHDIRFYFEEAVGATERHESDTTKHTRNNALHHPQPQLDQAHSLPRSCSTIAALQVVFPAARPRSRADEPTSCRHLGPRTDNNKHSMGHAVHEY